MLKNLKKVAAIVLSFAMAVQFGLADSYYVNAVEEPVEPQQQEETTTATPQEQEEVPTTEEETPQQQEEGQQQPAVEEEQPAAEEAQQQPVKQAKVNVSYVKEDNTDLMESVTDTYVVGYRLDQDTNVFKEAHEAFEFEYAFVNGNKENKITKDQVKASGLTVTSDMTSLTLVYKEKASTEKPKKANKQEPAKTETTSESDDASDVDTTESQETAVQLTEFFVVASQNQVTKGETAQLTLTIKPDNYPNKDVTWSSSNEATATVDENGVVTTLEVGTVTITATLKSDPTISSSVTIVVNPIKVSKITVTGYDKDYLVKGGTVTLTTTIEPSDAANKSIVWSSSNEEVATVDQNGKVTAVGQGTVSIKAMNDESGVYGEQVITVYDNTPITKRVNVWVTNESQGVSYQFNIPVNGTEVSPSQVARNTTKGDKTLVSTAQFRVLNNTVAQQRVWATISSVSIVKSFKYNQKRKKVEYTTDGQTWKTISSDEQIYDFTSMQWTGTDNNTDVKVAVGDWPYGAGVATSHNKQTIQIIVLNTENNDAQVYNSGVMRYDNGSNGNYGKIYFDCDTSKFEVSKVEVYKNNNLINSYKGSEIPKLINVQFQSYQTNKYVVKAYIKAKTIHVNYDANKGTGAPKGTTVKSTDKVTVDSTTRPTRDGYIFTGWTYGGKLYQGGESFDAPTSDVTFVAQWVKASEVINYTVNDSKMGSVSRSYERIGETVQGIVQGSTAIAETGYRFVKWVKGTDPKADAVSTDVEYKPTTKGTYMAVFDAVTSDLVIRYVDTDGKDISDSETKSYKYGESYTETAKEIKGYRLKSESPITGTKGVAREEITFVYTQKKGKVVYNLGPKGSWGNGKPENVELDTDPNEAAKGKWAYNYGFDKGDTFVVTESVPKSSDNAVFVGWYDKKRDNTPATMRKAGDTVTYPYTEASNTNTYTLDALWEKLQGTNKESSYDGTAHSLDEFTVKFANENLQGWTDSASSLVQASNIQYRLKQDGREVNEWGAMPSFKDAGVYTVEAKATVNGVELAAEATLTITPKSVTLTTESATRAYNGQPLTAPGTITGFVEGEGAKVVTTKSQTAIGETSNDGYNIVWDENTKESNYSVNVGEIGTLTVTDQSIEDSKKITVGTLGNVVYNGKNQKQEPAVTTKDGKTTLVKGTDYTLSYSKDTKNVGEVTVTVTGKGNYSGTVQRKYQITKAPLTVETQSDSKVYDGKPLTAPGTVKGFVEGENAELQVTGTQTAVGSSKNTYKIVWTETTKADNYQVSETVGTLTVTAQSIDPGTDPDYTGAKVNSPSDEVYDGNEHKWIPTVTDKTDKKLEAGTDYTVEYSTENFKDVGTIDVTITGIGNYSGTVKRSYKVTPKEYTVTTESATKTYSGTALTAGGKVEGIVSGETVEFTTTGSQTEVGTSKNTYEFVWKSAKATNYTLAKESIGELTVKAKSIVPDDKDTPESEKTGITVSEPSDSKYDGKEHKEVLTVTDTKTGKELVAGTDYSVTYSSDLVNAGTVTIKVAGLGNYTGSFEKTYKITKRSVTLTSATVSKVYDGSALTNTSITVSGDGFVEGEGASYEVTGTQTEVGNSANAFEYKLNEKTLASNYNITKVVGTLTITAAPAPVTPATPSTPSTPSSTTSTTPRTLSAPQVTTPVETVEKETTPKAEPKKEEKAEEEYTPKASPQYYWALINLICAILTVLFGLLLLISKRHKSEDDDEEDDETKQQTNNDDEEKEQEKKRGLFTRVLAVLIAIVSVVFFLVTEDLSLPWTWTDQWTIWMVVIGLVQIVVFFVGRKWKNVDNDDEDEEAQQA
ncbi:Ig-like domain-containing protein [Holdemanella porci]|uniref:Ig-like domain-containing protein n=1 Tax=Holdemanella porci TaxID=2652276 RepID=UPI0022E4D941|nr:Ig-like domain-containing protein [Holdemanella porci]